MNIHSGLSKELFTSALLELNVIYTEQTPAQKMTLS
jgi:hypothetical protein